MSVVTLPPQPVEVPVVGSMMTMVSGEQQFNGFINADGVTDESAQSLAQSMIVIDFRVTLYIYYLSIV